VAERLGDNMENDDTEDNELNITPIQELLKTVPDPYGGFEAEYTNPEASFNNKVAACVELINLGFDPFKYAKNNLIPIKTSLGIGIKVSKPEDYPVKQKINIENALNLLVGIANKLESNKELDGILTDQDEYTNNDITDSLPNLTLAVETKKILDELAAEKAKEEYNKQTADKQNKAYNLITSNREKSLEVINNGGKSAFRKSTEIDDFVEKEERPYYKNLKQKLERPEMIELVENYRTTLHEEAND
jgi:hypothetical protein